jgi:hypothetical protein
MLLLLLLPSTMTPTSLTERWVKDPTHCPRISTREAMIGHGRKDAISSSCLIENRVGQTQYQCRSSRLAEAHRRHAGEVHAAQLLHYLPASVSLSNVACKWPSFPRKSSQPPAMQLGPGPAPYHEVAAVAVSSPTLVLARLARVHFRLSHATQPGGYMLEL